MPLSSNQNSRDQFIVHFAGIKKYTLKIHDDLRAWRSKSMPRIRRYSHRTVDVTIRTVLVLFLTYLLFAGLVFATRTLWFLYTSAPVGANFAASFPEKAAFFQFISRVDLFGFSYDVTLAGFKTCFLTAIICQVFHIARRFYFSRGFFGRVMGWGGLLTAGTAYRIWHDYALESFAGAYLVAAIPTLCVLTTCFNFAEIVLPEIGDLLNHKWTRRIISEAKKIFIRLIEMR